MSPEIPWEELFKVAWKARENAYAPYSKFQVGAAVLADDGSILAGCNVENASYGLSLCAERNAFGRMAVEGKRRAVAVAIVTGAARPTPPCGMCRQTMAEFADGGLQVRSRNAEGQETSHRLDQLLPAAFTPDML